MQGTNLNMGLQLYHHMAIVSQISARLGFHKAKRHLKQCLYYMNIGTNDYEQNYFLPDSFDTSSKYTPEEYAKDLINRLSNYLQVCIFIWLSVFILGSNKIIINVMVNYNNEWFFMIHNRLCMI